MTREHCSARIDRAVSCVHVDSVKGSAIITRACALSSDPPPPVKTLQLPAHKDRPPTSPPPQLPPSSNCRRQVRAANAARRLLAGTCSIPDGSVVRCGLTGDIFQLEGGARRKFSGQAYAAHVSPKVVLNEGGTCRRIYGCPVGERMPDAHAGGLAFGGWAGDGVVCGGRGVVRGRKGWASRWPSERRMLTPVGSPLLVGGWVSG